MILQCFWNATKPLQKRHAEVPQTTGEKKKKKETNNRLNVFTISLVENISRKVLK